MLHASDFRSRAREALRGHWGTAIGVCFVAALLSGILSPTGSSAVSSQTQNMSLSMSYQSMVLLETLTVAGLLLSLFLGGVISLGQATYCLKLADHREGRFSDLFSQFHRFGAGFAMNLLTSLFISLWSLLLVIPGIIATYRYAMTPYLMAEHPELGALEAIRESKRLMHGNKWRLFCLHFSFIGWSFLSVLTFGIGILWLSPYMETANAIFYRSLMVQEEPQLYCGPEF